ncbi:AAA family ATPase [Rhizobium brockwellii]|uniref:AAA family ATPase n=1 Tax=Rhizobium brockwellii TaxID=3019932 RepID=A0ABU3YMS1_9HYPH|nr:AAA family ATPase [Rhizobium brockwellii]MDV4180217.1 AAA family ATPase [Rhizobium brockwellii]MDV4187139.1 AAA family ATPase [Rhizobium brockwellii]
MRITVVEPRKSAPRSFSTTFVLKKDLFNDYGFQTRYQLYRERSPEEDAPFLVGTVKILRRGQTAADGLPILSDIVEPLGPAYCSVGDSLDYYERLNTLTITERDELLTTLRDVAAKPELIDEFQIEEGWTTSLFRGNKEWRVFLADANALYRGNFETLSDVDTVFSFFPRNSRDHIRFEFNSPLPEYYSGPYRRIGTHRRRIVLPERAMVLIGRNGSGKSTLLTDIAHVAFATPEERTRKSVRTKGRLEPNGIGFLRVITISYSAFDSFTLPGSSDADFIQIASDVARGEGRFVYCGLRDIAAEAKYDYDNINGDASKSVVDKGGDRRSTTALKSLDQLADEFERLLAHIDAVPEKRAVLDVAVEPLSADPSFAGLNIDEALDVSKGRELFLKWSTGHKIALHVVLSLVAHVSRNALVLFDEPEMHLHPPLTAALMHAVRIILTEANAFCIVATHSPVVLQETLARHVRFIERIDDEITIAVPNRETFGENVGLLTYDAFGLTASSTDFHEALDILVRSGEGLTQIEALFTNGLSSQARAYVLAKLATKEKLT